MHAWEHRRLAGALARTLRIVTGCKSLEPSQKPCSCNFGSTRLIVSAAFVYLGERTILPPAWSESLNSRLQVLQRCGRSCVSGAPLMLAGVTGPVPHYPRRQQKSMRSGCCNGHCAESLRSGCCNGHCAESLRMVVAATRACPILEEGLPDPVGSWR